MIHQQRIVNKQDSVSNLGKHVENVAENMHLCGKLVHNILNVYDEYATQRKILWENGFHNHAGLYAKGFPCGTPCGNQHGKPLEKEWIS